MATAKIIYRNNKLLSDNSHPVSIRISHHKMQTTYIRIKGMKVNSTEEWNTDLNRYTSIKANYKKLNKKLTEIENKVDSITEILVTHNDFSYDRFKQLYYGTTSSKGTLLKSISEKIISLRSLGKEGTALTYEYTKKALMKLLSSDDIAFEQINYQFLKSLEQYFLEEGIGGNTISIHMRNIRALTYSYFDEIDKPRPGVFKKFNIRRLETRSSRHSLNRDELALLIKSDEKLTNRELFARDIFIFSFLTRGMNHTDIALITEKNLQGDNLTYRRSKTSGLIQISINCEIRTIIDKYIKKGEDYVFPIIQDGMNIKQSIRLSNRSINSAYARIAKKLNIPHFSFYSGRNTWANLARQNNYSIEKISQGLGHRDLQTTKVYLSSFTNSEIDDITTDLLANIIE